MKANTTQGAQRDTRGQAEEKTMTEIGMLTLEMAERAQERELRHLQNRKEILRAIYAQLTVDQCHAEASDEDACR